MENTFEVPEKIIETDDNYILLFNSMEFSSHWESSYLLLISKDGSTMERIDFNISDTIFNFIDIYETLDGFDLIGVQGWTQTGFDKLLFCSLDNDYSIFKQNELSLKPDYYNIKNLYSFCNQDSGYILAFSPKHPERLRDICFYHISKNGDSLNYNQLELPYDQYCLGILPNVDYNGFYVFSIGSYNFPPQYPPGTRISVNDNLFAENIDTIPGRLFGHYFAKWYSDTSYLLVGTSTISQEIHGIGLMENSISNHAILENQYGLNWDTLTKSAYKRSLDFIDENEIFVSGTANLEPVNWPFQESPSWVMINKVDADFNIIWQKFFGGDAFYVVWDTQMSSDNCYLLACSKYVYEPGSYDYDLLVIKIDENGIITGTDDKPPPIQVNDAIVYPNPGSSYLKVESGPQIDGALFELFDMTGKMAARETLNSRLMEINTSHLPSGNYTYRINWKNRLVGLGKWVKH
jgi:hypothetical protein